MSSTSGGPSLQGFSRGGYGGGADRQQRRNESRERGYGLEHVESDYVNIGGLERIVTAAGGLALAWFGYERRTPLAIGLAAVGGVLLYRALSGHCDMYQALGLNTARGSEAARPQEYFERGIHVEETLTIDRPRAELFRFWRNFENLPRFMKHLESVRVLDDRRSHWVAKAPAGTTVEWDAEIINEEPDALIAWRSLENADVDNSGSVRFLDSTDGRGTELKVILNYIPPAGRVGSAIASIFGREPSQEIREDLRRFKRLIEAGEITTTA